MSKDSGQQHHERDSPNPSTMTLTNFQAQQDFQQQQRALGRDMGCRN